MSFVRRIENSFFGRIRDRRAGDVADTEAGRWSTDVLRGHKYCLLTSFRVSGEPVATPVWFGTAGDRIYIRSGARDGKIKRIRRDQGVLVSPCGARGTPLGPPMQASARILEPHEYGQAEDALRSSYGLGRRLYRLVRRRIEVAYLEVAARDS